MAIENFIPTVWSEMLLKSLEKKYIAVAHCNRNYEGEIREKGNIVRINGLENVAIRDYVKNTNMELPETLQDFYTDLEINQAKYFNFQIDDIDRAQASPKLMEAAIKNAASALANEADAAVFKLFDNIDLTIPCGGINENNVLRLFVSARGILYEANVMDSDDIVIEVSPEIATLITTAKLTNMTDNTDIMENGCIGSIAGCKVFVSNNILVERDPDTNQKIHKCIIRTKRAIAFAEQLSEIQAYRPELRFADAVKGLYLYGCKIIHPNEIVGLMITESN